MIDYEREYIRKKFESDFANFLYRLKQYKNSYEIVFLCVGTDRITGDCLGPIVGTKLTKFLKNSNLSYIDVYGNLEENLSYQNIEKKLEKINTNACIVVIDAALSKKENIGKIFVTSKKTILGKGLNKTKIELGDISIKVVVEKDSKIPNHNFKILQNTSLNKVINLSEIVSDGIINVLQNS